MRQCHIFGLAFWLVESQVYRMRKGGCGVMTEDLLAKCSSKGTPQVPWLMLREISLHCFVLNSSRS